MVDALCWPLIADMSAQTKMMVSGQGQFGGQLRKENELRSSVVLCMSCACALPVLFTFGLIRLQRVLGPVDVRTTMYYTRMQYWLDVSFGFSGSGGAAQCWDTLWACWDPYNELVNTLGYDALTTLKCNPVLDFDVSDMLHGDRPLCAHWVTV